MCWIFAYNWKNNSVPLLIDWLRSLEYRGYDSAWVIWVNKDWEIFFKKSVWRVSNLASKVEDDEKSKNVFTTWIAHTRWATHWVVNEENTHPHYSQNERFYVVHNWIIENYKELKEELEKKYSFYSQTDTEIIAKLLEEYFETDLKTTIKKIIPMLVWAYAVAIIDRENPKQLIWVKLWSPLLIWEWEEWVFLSSDINALSQFATNYVSVEDYEIVDIEDWDYNIYFAWEKVIREKEKIDSEYRAWSKWNFKTFTEKEIYEIPEVLENAMKWRIDFLTKSINSETLNELNEQEIERIEIIASWSSYFAWYLWSYYFKELAWIPTSLTISSEFLCDTFLPNKKTLYIFLSQSWETADVRESLKIVKEKWCLTFWIVNSVWSTIAKMADFWLYCHSWVEVWVASTKNIIAQDVILLIMAISLWSKRNLQHTIARWIIEELWGLKDKLNEVLLKAPKIKEIAKKYVNYKSMFFLWRNLLYPIASEWSLKCKELSYIHTEAYSTWELKHWPLALVWPDFPCVVFNPKTQFYHKTVSNIKEIKARHWRVLWFITKWENNSELYDDVIELPETSEILSPFVSLVAIDLFALYLAEELWKDVDKPQNLAKSVTVE